jgi:hypothetical protein
MIKYITTALMLLVIATSTAQTVRADTTTLGIYNTGARFLLTRADFGQQTATDILADMVIAYDTVQIATIVRDTGRSSRVRHSYEKRCNMIAGLPRNSLLFKDKIVLMELNKDCDVTQLTLLAQRSGAKAFVFIHNSNSNGNIHLPKKGLYPDSIRIPVFIVGNEHGKNISALLPSKAGIKTKIPPPVQGLSAKKDSTFDVFASKQHENTEGVLREGQNDQTGTNAAALNPDAFKSNSFGIGKQAFSISPNPTRDQTTLTYQFAKAVDVTFEVKTASGQVILSKILRGITVGSLEIPTTDWSNGTYFISLQSGKEIRTKTFVVQH